MNTSTQPVEIDVDAFRVSFEIDSTDQLLVRVAEKGVEVYGAVVRDWRTPGQEKVVAEVGNRPKSAERHFKNTMSQAREYAPYIPVI